MNNMNNTEFINWLRKELQERDWSQNELARRAGFTSAGVSLVMTGERNPGPEFCQAIARVLKLPQEEVFLRAGLLESPLSRLFAELSVEQREIILTEMRKMVEENERAASKATLRPAATRV